MHLGGGEGRGGSCDTLVRQGSGKAHTPDTSQCASYSPASLLLGTSLFADETLIGDLVSSQSQIFVKILKCSGNSVQYSHYTS